MSTFAQPLVITLIVIMLSVALYKYAMPAMVSADQKVDHAFAASAYSGIKDPLKPMIGGLVGAAKRPESMEGSVTKKSGLVGKGLSEASSAPPYTVSEGVDGIPLSAAFNMAGKTMGGKVIPPVIDPSASFLQSEVQINKNPSYDIRGDYAVDMSKGVPTGAAMPTYGPFQPKTNNIRSNNNFPKVLDKITTSNFFADPAPVAAK